MPQKEWGNHLVAGMYSIYVVRFSCCRQTLKTIEVNISQGA